MVKPQFIILVFLNQIEFLSKDKLEESDVAMGRFVYWVCTVITIQLVCLFLDELLVVSHSKSLDLYLSYCNLDV